MEAQNAKVPMVLFAGNSHQDLARQISDKLGIRLGDCNVFHTSNRETGIEIGESVRGKDVFVLQTGTKNVNNDIMESLIMAYACKTSCARHIVGVLPYLPYSKQSKMRKRGSIVSKLIASMMTKAGFTHIITMDLHQKEVQGFFDCPVDNLRASPFLIQYIRECIPDYRNAVIVARHAGAVKRATSYAERLRLGIAVIHGEEKVPESERDDGRNSPPPLDIDERPPPGLSSFSLGLELLPNHMRKHTPRHTSMMEYNLDARVPDHMRKDTPKHGSRIEYNLDAHLPEVQAKEKPPINVVGDVGGRIAILVDDLIDDCESFVSASHILKERGAYKIYVMATHGLLSAEAPRMLDDSPIDEVVVTNTIPHDVQKMQCSKIKTVDISIMLSEAIRRIHNQESMSHLFQHISSED